MTRTGYLGLGSNVGDRAEHLRAAVRLLREEGVEVDAVSSLYETEPVGEILDQPDFLNAAVRIRTGLGPEELLDLCKAIEVEQGRMLAGQRLEFDVSFDVPDCDAVLTDRLEDTVDYAEVCDIVALAATERSYRTLERLAQVIGERLMERYGCDSVRVRAAKPEPPLPLAMQEVAVEVTHDREDAEEPEEDEGA